MPRYNIKKLETEMLRRGLTRWKLARLAKLKGQSTVTRMFAVGSAHPDNIEKVARVLGFRLEDLVIDNGSTGNPRSKKRRKAA